MPKDLMDYLGDALDAGFNAAGDAMDAGFDAAGRGLDCVLGGNSSSDEDDDDYTEITIRIKK